MPKGQLLWVPCLVNSGMPFTFQPTLCFTNIPTYPASYSHSTSTSLHSICFMSSFLLLFFFFNVQEERSSSKYHAATSKYWNDTWKWYIHSLFQLQNVNRSTTLINITWVTLINYSQEKLCNFADLKRPTLTHKIKAHLWHLSAYQLSLSSACGRNKGESLASCNSIQCDLHPT